VITVLTKGRLLDCVGDEPLEDASVVIEDGDIKDVYSGEKPLPQEATVIDVGGRTIMPGLTDAHMHIAYTHPSISMQFQDSPIVTALLIKDNCERRKSVESAQEINIYRRTRGLFPVRR